MSTEANFYVCVADVCEEDAEVCGVATTEEEAWGWARKDAWDCAERNGGIYPPWAGPNHKPATIRVQNDRPHSRWVSWSVHRWSPND